MSRGVPLRDRIAAGVLEAAAEVLAKGGQAATMDEIAAAAGIGRATLYRYYPSRDVLLRGLADAALHDVTDALRLAEIDTGPFAAGLARVTRAFLPLATKYVALMREENLTNPGAIEREVGEPIRSLFLRGAAEGALRPDLPAEVTAELYGWLLQWAMEVTVRGQLSVERATSAILSLIVSVRRDSCSA